MTEAKQYMPPMLAYFGQMVAEMQANEAKATWKGLGVPWALEEVHYHVAKLHWAVRHISDNPAKYLAQVREYSADIGNICMMLADEAGVLDYPGYEGEPLTETPIKTNHTAATWAAAKERQGYT